jgi:antitoxin (DNA-binding transcriptional repressor) of toxin-antitoxin stability system
MKTITMLELREDTSSFLKALKKGTSFLLTYRGEKIAKIESFKENLEESAKEDPFFLLPSLAIEEPKIAAKNNKGSNRESNKSTLTNEDIDRIVYGE